MSRGRGVLVKLRVEHRLSLEELALVLYATHEDVDAEEHFTVADIRQVIAAQLVREGTDSTYSASDAIGEADDHGESDEAQARLAWARRMVAKAYRRDFAKYPAELAAFEAGESR
jgi:hypothetical protein